MASLRENEAPAARRRHVRALLLAAAKARAADALTLQQADATAAPLFAPFSPSPPAVLAAVWTQLEAANLALRPEDLLVDLGCGDGRWLVSGVERFQCSALGVELDATLVARAQAEVRAHGLEHKICVQQGDVMEVDVCHARLVIVYAFAESLAGIAQRLQAQLGKNASVLSVGFRVPEWKPHWHERVDGLRWYLYRMSDCVGNRASRSAAPSEPGATGGVDDQKGSFASGGGPGDSR